MSKLAKVLFSVPIFFGMIFIISVVNSRETYTLQKQAPVTFKSMTPNLVVEDMETAIFYYQEVLGFKLLMSTPERKPFDRAIMRRENITLMFRTKRSLSEEMAEMKEMPVGGLLTFYVDVNNLRDLYEQVRGKADITKDPYDTFYGTKEFVIRDCNGYLITFSEEKQK